MILHSQPETNSLEVSYGDDERPEQRSKFVWVLFPEKKITVRLVNELVFQIRFPEHGEDATLYQEARDAFINDPENGCLEILQLNMNTHQTIKNHHGALVPDYDKVYTKFGELGAGSFGSVHEVKEVSTATRFAMKTVLPGHVRYAEVRAAHQAIKKEAAMLAGLTHVRPKSFL